MNTSEIKPLHLSVPRQRGAPRPAQPTQPALEKPKAEEPATQRILSQRYLAGKRPDPKEISSATTGQLRAALVETAQSFSPARLLEAVTPSEDRLQIGSAARSGDFWLYPLAPSSIRLIFRVDSAQMPWQFVLGTDAAGSAMLSAKMNGSTRAAGVTITSVTHGCHIAEGRLDRGANVFYFVATVGSEQSEACAGVFSNKQLIDLIIPAIKKIEGKSRMCPIAPGDFSVLHHKMTQHAKEAIRLRAREAEADLTFRRRFEVASPQNFVLYHESNTKKDLCTFGRTTDGNYAMEVGYPLSMVQAFIAAICATLPD